MQAYVLNDQFIALAAVDDYISFIWTERYDKCGDFELYMPIGASTIQYLQPDFYLYLEGTDCLMVIEDVVIKSNPEDGARVTVTGRSLESILDRRVIWGVTSIEGKLQDGIKTLLDNNVISPSIASRKIDNFIFEASDDTYITGLTLDAVYFGEDLYETIQSLCETNGIGFKVRPDKDWNFVFKLFRGEDRSYDQMANPYVIFSPSFDNLANSNYVETKSGYKTAAMVAGPQESVDDETATDDEKKIIVDCVMVKETGIHRRETFVDASDIPTSDDSRSYPDEYIAKCAWEKGYEELQKTAITQALDGEAEITEGFRYGVDFFLGDIVQIENEYGISTTARVSEIVWSHDESGETVIPSFTTSADDQ